MRALVLTGTCGSGKSTIAALLAGAGWCRICEDDLWRARFGRERGAFGSAEHTEKRRQVHDAVFAAVVAAIARGQDVVIDATVHESPPAAFDEYRQRFAALGIDWSLRVLHPSLEVSVARDARRTGWHAGSARVADLRAKFTGSVFGAEAFLDTSNDSPEETVARLLAG